MNKAYELTLDSMQEEITSKISYRLKEAIVSSVYSDKWNDRLQDVYNTFPNVSNVKVVSTPFSTELIFSIIPGESSEFTIDDIIYIIGNEKYKDIKQELANMIDTSYSYEDLYNLFIEYNKSVYHLNLKEHEEIPNMISRFLSKYLPEIVMNTINITKDTKNNKVTMII